MVSEARLTLFNGAKNAPFISKKLLTNSKVCDIIKIQKRKGESAMWYDLGNNRRVWIELDDKKRK
jgi:hypothetical protein